MVKRVDHTCGACARVAQYFNAEPSAGRHRDLGRWQLEAASPCPRQPPQNLSHTGPRDSFRLADELPVDSYREGSDLVIGHNQPPGSAETILTAVPEKTVDIAGGGDGLGFGNQRDLVRHRFQPLPLIAV